MRRQNYDRNRGKIHCFFFFSFDGFPLSRARIALSFHAIEKILERLPKLSESHRSRVTMINARVHRRVALRVHKSIPRLRTRRIFLRIHDAKFCRRLSLDTASRRTLDHIIGNGKGKCVIGTWIAGKRLSRYISVRPSVSTGHFERVCLFRR